MTGGPSSPAPYKEQGGGRGTYPKVHRHNPTPTVPTDLGLRSADGKHRQDLAPPPRRPPSLGSAGGGRRGTATHAEHRRRRNAALPHRRTRASPTPTSSPPSLTRLTRWRPPAPARPPRQRPTVCALLSPSFLCTSLGHESFVYLLITCTPVPDLYQEHDPV